MSIIELPIKDTYVPDWGTWEVLRELIQNAKDEEEALGIPMKIWHDGKYLFIRNPGADFDRRVLLLGETTKTVGGSSRGQFGEGLNLALLAGVRGGLELTIETQYERWVPTIEKSREFGENVLKVRTRKLRTKRDGITIWVKISKELWEESKKLFLFLTDLDPEKSVKVNDGTILLGSEYAGMVFVKGIFVFKHKDLKFGYDLDKVEMDRDRRMVNMWDLKWELGVMFGKAASQRPDLMTKTVYDLLRNDDEDVRGLDTYHVEDETKEQLAQAFVEEHGEKAVPVSSIAESQSLDHLGRRGIVVPDTLRKILSEVTGTAETIQKELETEKLATYAWGDLEPKEKANLEMMCELVDEAITRATGEKRASFLMGRLDVVDFRSSALQGMCELGSGRIQIAKRILSDRRVLLLVLVHEEAHALSRAGDGSVGFDDTMQEIWSHIVDALLAIED